MFCVTDRHRYTKLSVTLKLFTSRPRFHFFLKFKNWHVEEVVALPMRFRAAQKVEWAARSESFQILRGVKGPDQRKLPPALRAGGDFRAESVDDDVVFYSVTTSNNYGSRVTAPYRLLPS